jgi:hypothetical protein
MAAYSGVLVRYDTTASFGSGSSWEAYDLTMLDPSAKLFPRATFDGRYLYLAPGLGTKAIRFAARSTSALPPAYAGSFY